MSLRSKISEIIFSKPGLTAVDISEMVYGPGGDRYQVGKVCRDLMSEGLVRRLGSGTRYDPFTYVWFLPQTATSTFGVVTAIPALLELQQSLI